MVLSHLAPQIREMILPRHYLKKFFFSIGVELIYNAVLVFAIEQSGSVIHIHISTLFRFFSHVGHYRVLRGVPYAPRSFLLFIYFTYCRVYMSVPFSQLIAPTLYPLVTLSVFSTSVILLTLFLFKVHLYLFFSVQELPFPPRQSSSKEVTFRK